MEIHPPGHTMRTWRAFASHMFTVTCGILIALGFEQAVVLYNDATLARHARADFSVELTANIDRIKLAQRTDTAVIAPLKILIGYGETLLKHPKAPPPAPRDQNLSRGFPILPSAAWSGALATQALIELTSRQSRALALAYNRQDALNDLTEKARDQWITIAGLEEDANYTDPELRGALAQLRVGTAYTQSLIVLQQQVIAADQSALATLN